MRVVSFTAVRNNLTGTIKKVWEDDKPVIIVPVI